MSGNLFQDFGDAIGNDINGLEKGASDLVKSVNSQIGKTTDSARQALAQAMSGPLAGSSIGSDGKVHGPLGQAFGEDPLTFCLNGVKAQFSRCVDLVNRVAKNRLGATSLPATAANGKTVHVQLHVTHASSAHDVAAALCAELVHHPATVADEVQRIMIGAGPGKGLDGFVGTHHLFGIDDAIIFGGIVSILTVLAPVLIGGLIAVITTVGAAVVGKPAANGQAAQPGLLGGLLGGGAQAAPPAGIIPGTDQSTSMMIIVGGLALVAIVAYAHFHKKKAA